jgi:hypothetical protein
MTSDTQQSWAEFTSFSARFVHLLRRAARIWAKPTEATASDAAAAAKEWREETAEADGRDHGRLPWWAVHHPAVSFRGRAPEDRLD